MKIIISPAKKMRVQTDQYPVKQLPVFLDETEQIMTRLRQLSFAELKNLWKCNDKIAETNYQRLQDMKVQEHLTPAIISYEGIQYQYMAPGVFTDAALEYIEQHLRILSGFYGVLKPFDGVTPYRLEMQAKLDVGEHKDLYGFWRDKLYQNVMDGEHIIINLASKEYSRCVEAYLKQKDQFITCVFGELTDGKVVQKGTLAKMARGEMVRFMAEHAVERTEELKEFSSLGYCFSKLHSNEKEYVFIRKANSPLTEEHC